MRKSKSLLIFIAMLAFVLMLGTATMAMAAGEVIPDPANGEMPLTGDTADNWLGNANQTGVDVQIDNGSDLGSVIKSTYMENNTAHRTHGEYKNNTNACASCHQTHTGASKNLLFKDGVYNTCSACHDGTLGFYNVFKPSNAGTFGGTEMGNMSVHLANGTVANGAAPGGNSSWTGEFNCAACHSAHGSYADRLLNYNPNGMGRAAETAGGIGLVQEAIYDFGVNMPTAGTGGAIPAEGKLILVRGTANQFGLDVTDGLAATDKVIRVYTLKLNSYGANSWVASSAPMLYGYAYANPNKNYWTRFFVGAADDTTIITEPDGTKHYKGIVDNHDQDWNANLKFDWAKGYVVAKSGDTILNNLTKGDVARAYTVAMKLDPIADFRGVPIYTSDVNALYDGRLAGEGIKMSAYCASCHTDYMAHSTPAGVTSGTFSQAYRHSTDSDSYTCVRCHYAHGTDVTVMLDAKGVDFKTLEGQVGTPAATDYMLDRNPSSALKRYTNMAVCWGCHTDSKAADLKNTYSYGDADDPHGLVAQPQMPGEITAPPSLVTNP